MNAQILYTPSPVEQRPLHHAELPIPQPLDDELLVRVHACGICRTDLHVVETATLTATTPDGTLLTSSRQFELSRRQLPPMIGTRFSILFEFDESKTVKMYEDFLREHVAPSIPDGSMVYVHGHTDIVGEEDYNQKLSEDRAENTVKILDDEMKQLGRSVTFEGFGSGEDEELVEYSNTTPEGRYHNRTVVIDIVPGE